MPHDATPAVSPLHSKRDAEKNLDLTLGTLNKYLLAMDPSGAARLSTAWSDLYYSSATSGAFAKKAARFAKEFPHAAATCAAAVECVKVAFIALETARAAEKAELNERRAARAAKAAKKKELGVDLRAKSGGQGTEATYKLLRVTLESFQDALKARIGESLMDARAKMVEEIGKAGGDAAKVYPAYEYRSAKVRPGEIGETPMHFWRYFSKLSHMFRETRVSVIPMSEFDYVAFIAHEASCRAEEVVASYAAKLAGRVDAAAEGRMIERADLRLVGGDIWAYSYIDVIEAGGRRQVWKTKMIWNRSVLGKDFNQWPTTRVS